MSREINDENPNIESCVWLPSDVSVPDVCCTCGMFTDRRRILKHPVAYRDEPSSGPTFWVIMGVLLGLFLGPIGWLISIFAEPKDEVDQEGRVLVTKKVKIALPQCQLCSGTTIPDILDYQPNPQKFLIQVHPRFKFRVEEIINAKEQQTY